MKDKISALVFLSLGAFFLIGALRMPRVTEYGKYGAPGIVPAFFSIMVILLCTIMFLRRKKPEDDNSTSVAPDVRKVENKRLAIAAASFLIYVFLLGKINFVVLTSIFLSLFSIIFYRRKVPLLVGAAVGVTLGIYYLFSRVFLLPLP